MLGLHVFSLYFQVREVSNSTCMLTGNRRNPHHFCIGGVQYILTVGLVALRLDTSQFLIKLFGGFVLIFAL